MMKNNSLSNNNPSSCHSHTLNIIRSVIDELYQRSNEEVLSSNESKEKHVRFTMEDEMNRTESVTLNESKFIEISTESQPVLSVNGQSKVDCSVSTNDFPFLQCECATQTMNITECHHSLTSLLTDSNNFHRLRNDLTLSRTSLSMKPTNIHPFTLPSHSHYFCENSEILPSISTPHQLVLPSDAQNYDICEEQTEDNYDTFSTYTLQSFNSSIHSKDRTKLNDYHSSVTSNGELSDEHLAETNIKLCTCSKRKLSPLNKCTSPDHGQLLEELYLSSRSLQSMYNDGLFYIHDLVFIFLKNPSQFDRILVEHYHVSNRQANLFVKVMKNWLEKHRRELICQTISK